MTAAHLGIDYDTHRLHMVLLPPNGAAPWTGQAALREPQATAYDATRGVLAAVSRLVSGACGATDAVIIHAGIERGFGAHRRSDFLLGSIYGAVIASWSAIKYHRLGTIMAVQAADWKRHIGVAGNSRKDAANERAAMLWQHMWDDTPPSDPDLLDAFAIALTTRDA